MTHSISINTPLKIAESSVQDGDSARTNFLKRKCQFSRSGELHKYGRARPRRNYITKRNNADPRIRQVERVWAPMSTGNAYVSYFLLRKNCRSIIADVVDAAYNCPSKDGQYEDSKQCDKYYECIDGFATEKLCPDGLVFDPLNRKVNKCDHVFNVDCGDRLELRKTVSINRNMLFRIK